MAAIILYNETDIGTGWVMIDIGIFDDGWLGFWSGLRVRCTYWDENENVHRRYNN